MRPTSTHLVVLTLAALALSACAARNEIPVSSSARTTMRSAAPMAWPRLIRIRRLPQEPRRAARQRRRRATAPSAI